jgi:thioesterase domain-containing protein/aryl carrier-like protein
MAGEAASHALVQQWAPGRRLLNAYGPTETTVCASIQACDTLHPSAPPIGSPIANTRIYILDAHGQPTPLGVAGEIHIAGVQVARGYLHRPDLTAERFVPDPFGEPGSRMYRSGDLGRWRPDGAIEFLGRNDHQVKLRGFRIELGEIEAALRSHPSVREAVVLAREDVQGDKRLVAYVVGDVGQTAAETLRTHLGGLLPEYMIPAAYVPLNALPLTPNGKVDRKALPTPDVDALDTRAYEAPLGPIESLLASLWGELLGLERIGRRDHFFELGGHSLLATRLVAQAKQKGLDLTLQDAYRHPTLMAQAQCLRGALHSPGTRALTVRGTGKALPLFVLPTGTSDVTYAFELAIHLDTNTPVYAVPWPDEMPSSMDELAAQMVTVMQTVQPVGPYRLLSYSSGSLLAYAIAQHLSDQNESVDFLGMLDSELPSMERFAESPGRAARDQLNSDLTQLLEQQPFGAQEDVQQTLRQLADDLAHTPLDELAARYEDNAVLIALAAKQGWSVRQIAASYLCIARYHDLRPAYAARALPAHMKLHIFYATEEAAAPHPMGWQQLLPMDQLIVIGVPGTHASLIKPPHIEHVGRTVSTALRELGDIDRSQRSGDHKATRDGERDRTDAHAVLRDFCATSLDSP